MIEAAEAIRVARELIGTPYTEAMQCDDLIVETIRRSRGGVKGYRIAGTNWLWESIRNAGKYRHITWRQEGLGGARAGMLAFKRTEQDVHHVGIVTGEGSVIHSSSAWGCVAETPLEAQEGWNLLAVHRAIRVGADTERETGAETGVSPGANPEKTYIVCAAGGLRMRKTPGLRGDYMKMIPDGTALTALEERDGWIRCKHRGYTGWVCGDYCRPATGND